MSAATHAQMPRKDVLAFIGQLSGETARGRWACACEPRGHYAYPRNAWTDDAVRVIRARRAAARSAS